MAGRTPRLALAVMRELADRWHALQAALEKTSEPALTRIVSSPLARPMFTEACAVAEDYLTLLCTSCPQLYSLPVMDDRCRRGSAKAIVGILGSVGLGFFADLDYPLIADAAVVLLAMGAWHLLTSVQLRCVRRLISQLVRPALPMSSILYRCPTAAITRMAKERLLRDGRASSPIAGIELGLS